MTLTNRERFLLDHTELIYPAAAFTTGAYIAPLCIEGVWCWVVKGFEDDTYYNGQYLGVQPAAAELAGLVDEDEEDDNEGELAVCLGCARKIPASEAHNEINAGTFCEACYQLQDEEDE